jgi:demethylspheroidene O-methyltransferase
VTEVLGSRSPEPLGWRDRWRALRNAVIGDAGFQRWAGMFPLTRPVARRRARALFDLTAGFVYSQITYACVHSGILTLLAAKPQSTAAVGRHAHLSPSAAERLLKAGAALGLTEACGDERWGLGQQGAALLGASGVAEMIEHHTLLYADLADPLALLQREGGGGRLSSYWPYAEGRREADAGAASAYSGLMSASQGMVSAQVLDAYPLRRHRRLLDVGGGDGTFLRAVAARCPGLELELFDLPAVADVARGKLATAGVAADVRGGSFLNDPLPQGADVISLVRVLHDHDDAAVLTVLKAVRRALAPNGTLLIVEPMSDVRGAEPIGDAYFGFYLLAMGSGRPRSVAELHGLLTHAGFSRSRLHRTAMPMIAQVLAARV